MIERIRTKEEIRNEIYEQWLALQSSSINFDAGHEWEAKRIATSLYTFLHDGNGRTKSLLSQANLKDEIKFLSTALPIGGPARLALILHLIRPNECIRFVPISADDSDWQHFRMISFTEWWNEPIFLSNTDEQFSRGDLIRSFRSRDGGSHYDATLEHDPHYLGTSINPVN